LYDPAMSEFTATASGITIVAPELLWDLLCDTSRYADWSQGTLSVTAADGPARLGTTYSEVNPILGPWKAKSRWTVVEFDAPRRQVHRTSDIQVAKEFLAIMEVAPSGSGSRFSLSLKAVPSLGPVGDLVFRALGPQTRRDNERSVANLVELAERELAS